MPRITVERGIGATKRAVIAGLVAYNRSKSSSRVYKRFAVSLREEGEIVGGIIGEVWMTVLFIQLFWIDEKFRGKGHGEGLIAAIEDKARAAGAVRAYVDTMSFQAPGFYEECGYAEFGAIDGYPEGITRHWLTKSLAGEGAP